MVFEEKCFFCRNVFSKKKNNSQIFWAEKCWNFKKDIFFQNKICFWQKLSVRQTAVHFQKRTRFVFFSLKYTLVPGIPQRYFLFFCNLNAYTEPRSNYYSSGSVHFHKWRKGTRKRWFLGWGREKILMFQIFWIIGLAPPNQRFFSVFNFNSMVAKSFFTLNFPPGQGLPFFFARKKHWRLNWGGAPLQYPPHGLALKLSPQNPSTSPALEVAPLSPIGNFPMQNFPIAKFPYRGIPYAPVKF